MNGKYEAKTKNTPKNLDGSVYHLSQTYMRSRSFLRN